MAAGLLYRGIIALTPGEPVLSCSNTNQKFFTVILIIPDILAGMHLAFYPCYALSQWCHKQRWNTQDPPRLQSPAACMFLSLYVVHSTVLSVDVKGFHEPF